MGTSNMITVQLTNEEKYYTVAQIINQASEIFEFKFMSDDENFRKAIKKQIRRKLEGKEIDDGRKRNRRYKRKDVYQLLSNDLYGYFLKISQTKNKQDYEHYKNGNKQARAGERLQSLEEVASSRNELNELLENLKYKNIQDLQLDILREISDGIWSETEIKQLKDELVTKVKQRILFEFLYENLFDFFVDFNEEQYRNDLDEKIKIGDDLLLTNPEKLVVRKLADISGYYRFVHSKDTIRKLLHELVIIATQNSL